MGSGEGPRSSKSLRETDLAEKEAMSFVHPGGVNPGVTRLQEITQARALMTGVSGKRLSEWAGIAVETWRLGGRHVVISNVNFGHYFWDTSA
jgi:hypothetical protein